MFVCITFRVPFRRSGPVVLTFINTEVRKYESTKVRKYEGTKFVPSKVLSYFRTFVVRTTNYEGILSSKVLSYLRTKVPKVVRKYGSTFVQDRILSYESTSVLPYHTSIFYEMI